MCQKILLVDDDQNILHGFRRQLRKQFEIETAAGGKEGLEAVVKNGPFAVIVSDMQMPGMDGIQFLNTIRQIAPDSVRIMLTGNADQKTAMDAVNDGQIFRFLTKPCSTETLAKTLEAAVEQYRLITSERDLITKTLSGSISVLTEVLSLVNPKAFGQSADIRRLVRQMCRGIQVDNAWEIEIASMLSQIGCVTIPETTLAKIVNRGQLSQEERQAYRSHPQVGAKLIGKIPRLKGVAGIIAYQQKCYDGSGLPHDEKSGEDIPLGSRILKVVVDAVQLLSAGISTEHVLSLMYEKAEWYDPQLLGILASLLDVEYVIKSVEIDQLAEDMILDEHVVGLAGQLLIARGQEVTSSLRDRLMMFAATDIGVREPIRVRCAIDQCASGDTEDPDPFAAAYSRNAAT